MAYDESVAGRVREALAERSDIAEKRMFGGLAFLLNGNMCVGVVKDELMVRVGPDAYDDLVGGPHVREMDFSGRPMTGWVDRKSVV
jgi:TfoX/Sxy family transcriptional regulator of competence genes